MTLTRTTDDEIYFGEAKWTPWGTIECLVKMEETEEVFEFHATPDDPEDYGRELFELLSTKYVNQVKPCSDQEKFDYAAGKVLERRRAELKASDWVANGDVKLENQVEWLQYRQDLRDITLQEGYPFEINWSEKPALTHSTPLDTRVSRLERK